MKAFYRGAISLYPHGAFVSFLCRRAGAVERDGRWPAAKAESQCLRRRQDHRTPSLIHYNDRRALPGNTASNDDAEIPRRRRNAEDATG